MANSLLTDHIIIIIIIAPPHDSVVRETRLGSKQWKSLEIDKAGEKKSSNLTANLQYQNPNPDYLFVFEFEQSIVTIFLFPGNSLIPLSLYLSINNLFLHYITFTEPVIQQFHMWIVIIEILDRTIIISAIETKISIIDFHWYWSNFLYAF